MDWYYSEADQQRGPVTAEQLEELVRQGTVRAESLVWRAGMTDWQPYGQVNASMPAIGACAQCGRIFPPDDLIQIQGMNVCAECKPLFLQRLREGAPANPRVLRYAGFWIRLVAAFLDGLLLAMVQFAVRFVVEAVFRPSASSSRFDGPGDTATLTAVLIALQYGIAIGYETIFIGRWGSTLGKMALGLKVIQPDGSPVGYGRAFGRYFAKILSALILCIGYIMIAFDKEKRGLHDMICGTRVIRK